jgi:hypothetical protein
VCGTLPVVYAAVARRLGYPLRLVRTLSHIFNRWDDRATGERLNVDASGHDGISFQPDEHYGRDWFDPLTAEEQWRYGYLKSLTPREELAHFVARRGFEWRSRQCYRKAIESFVIAADLDVRHALWPNAVNCVTGEWSRAVRDRRPVGFPRRPLVLRGPRWWPTLPPEVEGRIRYVDAVDNLKDRMACAGRRG